MYTWCCARLPRRLVDVVWTLWYAFLLVQVIECLVAPGTAIFYMHG